MNQKIYYQKAKKQAPKDRPPLYDGTNLLELAPRKALYNFEYFMNREYAFNRDRGVCRCCRTTLNLGHCQCHHINPFLTPTQVNKVPNLAWVCDTCHEAIHGKGLLAYAIERIKSKIRTFQVKLTSSLSNSNKAWALLEYELKRDDLLVGTPDDGKLSRPV